MSPTSPRQPGGAPRHAACSEVHRGSRSIHKQASSSSPPSSSSTHSSVSSSSTNSRPAPPPRQKQQQPVIIYTHSPKVIRTSPRDFMSIVQKLTGLDPARAAARNAGSPAAAGKDESSSSSSESCANAHAAAAHPYTEARLMPPPPPLLDAHLVAPPDIPLFAPGPSELQLCVPQGLYDELPAIDAAPLGPLMHSNNMNGGGPVFSPSMVEAMRTFQDF